MTRTDLIAAMAVIALVLLTFWNGYREHLKLTQATEHVKILQQALGEAQDKLEQSQKIIDLDEQVYEGSVQLATLCQMQVQSVIDEDLQGFVSVRLRLGEIADHLDSLWEKRDEVKREREADLAPSILYVD